jgi:hypothetical protein
MTIHQKSVLAWIIGGVAGGVAGFLSARPRHRSRLKDSLLGLTLGTIVVGSVTDKWLESQPGYTGS